MFSGILWIVPCVGSCIILICKVLVLGRTVLEQCKSLIHQSNAEFDHGSNGTILMLE